MKRYPMMVLIFLLTVFVVLVVFSLENQPHAFKECISCHYTEKGRSSVSRRLRAPVTQLCTDACHRTVLTQGYMHPVNVTPQKIPVPADLPLSPDGEIVCSTCHDIHMDYRTRYGELSHYLRRGERGKAFCRICHKRAGTGHGTYLGEAHFQARYVVTDSSQEIDPLSKNCISCHDGSFASSPTIMAGSWTHEKSLVANDRGSHPIGIDYEACRMRQGRKTDLKPISSVDWRIRFFQGKLGCGSCHDPYSLIPKRLVMSDKRSQLCLSCHLI
jgi:predicted CXXCH cytochrome family protein